MDQEQMTTILRQHCPVKRVVLRPCKARAHQFHYEEDCGKTREQAEYISVALGVEIRSNYDAQSGTGYFVKTGDLDSSLVRHGDWIVVDSFGKVSLVRDADFKVYYEPE